MKLPVKPASDGGKHREKDKLTQERRVNAFLLKTVISLKKSWKTSDKV